MQTLTVLRRLSSEKLSELGQTIALWTAGQHDAALALVRSDRGLDLVEDVRAQIETMRAQEEQLLRQRAATDRRWGAAGVLSLGALALILLVLLLRNLSERDRALLFASEQRLRTTFTSIGDAVIATDNSGASSGRTRSRSR